MPRKTNFTTGNNSYFRVTATVGKTPEGLPIRKQFYGDSKKAAETKRDDYLAGLKQGLAVNYDKATFGVAFADWLENIHRHKISLTTYDKYQRFHRLYIADCGLVALRLTDIRKSNIEACYNALADITTAGNVEAVHKILKTFFNYCMGDIIVKNPLQGIKLSDICRVPEPSQKNTALSDEDIEKLIQAAKDDIKYFPFVFACFTGLRSGELRALTIKDIDFKTGMINVDKSVKYLTVDGKYTPLLSSTKTKASIRKVPIPEPIQELLRAHMATLRQDSNVISITGYFLLFPSASGNYIGDTDILKSYIRLCDKIGIEKGRTIHSLRHTFCTILSYFSIIFSQMLVFSQYFAIFHFFVKE